QQLIELNASSTKEVAKSVENNFQQVTQEIQKSAEAVFAVYDELVKRSLNAQLQSLQLLNNQLQNRINLLIGLASRGAVNATDSIAILEKQQAEILQQQRNLQREAQRREIFLASLKTYAAALERTKDPLRALFDTIRNVTLIRQFAATLPTFYEGTEEVRPTDGIKLKHVARDPIIARLHPGERVVPADINRKLKGISNEDLAKLVQQDKTRVEFDFDSLHNALVMSIKNKAVEQTKFRLIGALKRGLQ
ncbi:MAG: hypothetical protein ACK4NC_07390, partial [Candidatus Gracilibacteria bacterium]